MDDLFGKAMPARNRMEEALGATGDLGKAAGLDVAVEVLRELAKNRPIVAASDLKEAADALTESAGRLRKRAQAVLDRY